MTQDSGTDASAARLGDWLLSENVGVTSQVRDVVSLAEQIRPVLFPPTSSYALQMIASTADTLRRVSGAALDVREQMASLQARVLQEPMTRIQATVARMNAQASAALRATSFIDRIGAERLVQGISEWQAIREAVSRQLEHVLRGVDWNALNGWVAELTREYPKQELRNAFATSYLVPAPSMPLDLKTRVVTLYRGNSGPSAVSNVVSARYRRSEWLLLDSVTKDWTGLPYLADRVELMNQARWAMRNGQFLLVAPSLVPHVEGLTADFLASRAGSRQKVKLGRLPDALEQAIPDWGVSAVGTEVVYEFLDFIQDVLFENIDFEQDHMKVRNQSVLNRHILLHGRGRKQATRMNGLRAFLLLDVLGVVALTVEQGQRP